jgi:hypothetical protein
MKNVIVVKKGKRNTVQKPKAVVSMASYAKTTGSMFLCVGHIGMHKQCTGEFYGEAPQTCPHCGGEEFIPCESLFKVDETREMHHVNVASIKTISADTGANSSLFA